MNQTVSHPHKQPIRETGFGAKCTTKLQSAPQPSQVANLYAKLMIPCFSYHMSYISQIFPNGDNKGNHRDHGSFSIHRRYGELAQKEVGEEEKGERSGGQTEKGVGDF